MSTFSTESRNEYYNIELVDAANKLVPQVRPVEPGQQVLITFDTASDERVARATAGAAYSKGGIPTVIFYPTLPEPMMNPPLPVSKAVLVNTRLVSPNPPIQLLFESIIGLLAV